LNILMNDLGRNLLQGAEWWIEVGLGDLVF